MQAIHDENPLIGFDEMAYYSETGYGEVSKNGEPLGNLKPVVSQTAPPYFVELETKFKKWSGTIIKISDDYTSFDVLTVAHDFVRLEVFNPLSFFNFYGVPLGVVLVAIIQISGAIVHGQIRKITCRVIVISVLFGVILIKGLQVSLFAYDYVLMDSTQIVYGVGPDKNAYKLGICHIDFDALSVWSDYALMHCATDEDNISKLKEKQALTPFTQNFDNIISSGITITAYSPKAYTAIWAIDTESYLKYPVHAKAHVQFDTLYKGKGEVTHACQNSWRGWIGGCYLWHTATVTTRMSGAACIVNEKFGGMLFGRGNVLYAQNRCVSFQSSSFISSLEKFEKKNQDDENNENKDEM